MKEEVERWIEQSEEDLDTAIVDFDNGKYKASAFWCQQSVEKGFKAILIQKTNKFPRIHDLVKLADLNNAPLRIKEACAKIDPAYMSSRYPDLAKKYTKEECEEVIEHCKEALKWIKKNLS